MSTDGARSSRSIAAPFRKSLSRRNCLGMWPAHSPVLRAKAAPAGSNWRTRERCAWTRSARCTSTCNRYLLRVLAEGLVYRVGDTRPRPVNVRLIAITNRDLSSRGGSRTLPPRPVLPISVTSITVPPLRDRVDDIEPLVDHFNRLLSARHHLPMRRFATDAMDALRRYRWPGNVRELRNLIERLLLTGDNELVTLDDLPSDLIGGPAPPRRGNRGRQPGRCRARRYCPCR